VGFGMCTEVAMGLLGTVLTSSIALFGYSYDNIALMRDEGYLQPPIDYRRQEGTRHGSLHPSTVRVRVVCSSRVVHIRCYRLDYISLP
jgi:hypothetical protein